MTVGSLFDGSGTAPLAAQILGWTPVWASEIEPYPVAVTSARFPDMLHIGDIMKIDGAKTPPVDVVVGGSPCQDLSTAGKQAGLQQGERSVLFFQMIRIIQEMRAATNGMYPRFIVWENVPGAFSSNQGDDFRAVVEAFCRLADDTVSIPRPKKWRNAGAVVGDGWSFAWRVLDAQYWGVPKRRRRIYAVLDLGSERAGEVLFERAGLPRYPDQSGAAQEGDSADVVGRANRGVGDGVIAFHRTQDPIASTERTPCMGVGGHGDGQIAVIYPENSTATLCARHDSALRPEIAPTMQSHPGGGQSLNCIPPVLYTQQGMGQYTDAGVAQTQLSRQYKDATDLIVEKRRRYIVRRLVPLECCRLQGVPDWWTDGVPGSDSAQYKMWGNGMALPCVLGVFHGIDKMMKAVK